MCRIGSACATHFAQNGCDLALSYSSNAESAKKLKQRLEEAAKDSPRQPRITIHKADLSSPEETTALCAEAQKEHGRTVDILISNAGYGKRIRDVS